MNAEEFVAIPITSIASAATANLGLQTNNLHADFRSLDNVPIVKISYCLYSSITIMFPIC